MYGARPHSWSGSAGTDRHWRKKADMRSSLAVRIGLIGRGRLAQNTFYNEGRANTGRLTQGRTPLADPHRSAED
jgi:hypothetical protein